MHFTEQMMGGQQLLRVSGDSLSVDVEYFNPDYLKAQNLLNEVWQGRGETWLFHMGEQMLVLRHYRRGGKAAMLRDYYVWTGLQQTRAWQEFKLLAELHAAGLPVPKPVAARVKRCGLFYQADLMTECLPAVRPMSALLKDRVLSSARWQDIGRIIRRFHDYQVNHADLNAHNILISESGIFLIDFDKSAIIKKTGRQNWKQGNLNRLLRSLQKIQKQDKNLKFEAKDWLALMNGYNAVQ